MIVPRPLRLEPRSGHFVFRPVTSIRAGQGAEPAAALLREALRPATGLALFASQHGEVRLTVDPALTVLGDEGYELDVRPDAVRLNAATPVGLLRGVQTIRQLLPPEVLSPAPVPGVEWRLPCLRVMDRPRFAWRGFMLDVARHFQPVSFVRGLIDVLALHKINVLHLHLTDDQGWRFPVDRYPALTEVSAWRTESMVGRSGSGRWDGVPHGGFYTKDELRGLVVYAGERGIEVVPEIAMPGHARAALAAYPELGNDPGHHLPVWTSWGISDHVLGVQPATLDFCENVLAEVMDVFPGRYVHLGGDECPSTQWEAGPAARARSAELGLASPAELYGWFVGRMTEFVLRNGRRPVCWDEAAEVPGLNRDVTVMAWRDQANGFAAARRGHPVVMAPWRRTYLDYAQSGDPGEPLGQPGTTTLADVHAFDPIDGHGEDLATDRILGTQAQIWTELAPGPRAIEYLTFPRLCALAEVAWSPAPRDSGDFHRRMTGHTRRLDALGVVHRAL